MKLKVLMFLWNDLLTVKDFLPRIESDWLTHGYVRVGQRGITFNVHIEIIGLDKYIYIYI